MTVKSMRHSGTLWTRSKSATPTVEDRNARVVILRILKRLILTSLAIGLLTWSGATPASATLIDFVLNLGNQGTEYIASPNLTITARGNVDPDDTLNPNAAGLQPDSHLNTVILSPDTGDSEKGLGVQEPDGSKGSTGISGKGHEKDEELIFSFQDSVLLSSMVLGLSDIDFGLGGGKNVDDPILYLFIDRLNSYSVFTSAEIENAFSFLDNNPMTLEGTLSFADLGLAAAGLLGNDAVSSFTLRNSSGELYVTTYVNSVNAVPLPGSLPLFAVGLLGLLGLLRWHGNRKASA